MSGYVQLTPDEVKHLTGKEAKYVNAVSELVTINRILTQLEAQVSDLRFEIRFLKKQRKVFETYIKKEEAKNE